MAKQRIKMPSATSIVARSHPDHIIGVENTLPWRLGTDMRHFRERTEGHAVIMGRRTYDSIGRPLPRRKNIVLSRTHLEERPGLFWAQDRETALMMADVFSICNFRTEFFIIGGERIYSLFEEFINKIFLTEVMARINGDAKFDWEYDPERWYIQAKREYAASETDDYPFTISTILRRRPQHRTETVERLQKADPRVAAFIERYEEEVGHDAASRPSFNFGSAPSTQLSLI